MDFIDLDQATCREGERALTAWYDMVASLCVVVTTDTGEVDKQDWEDNGIKGGVFRLAVVPITTEEAVVYLQVVPMDLQAFRAHLRKLRQDEFMTQLAARLPEVGKVQLLPREPGVSKAGFGMLPFLWVDTEEGMEVHMPDQEILKKEMFNLLRRVRIPKKTTLAAWMKAKGKESPPGTDAPAVLWPQYQKPRSEGDSLAGTLAALVEQGDVFEDESETESVEWEQGCCGDGLM